MFYNLCKTNKKNIIIIICFSLVLGKYMGADYSTALIFHPRMELLSLSWSGKIMKQWKVMVGLEINGDEMELRTISTKQTSLSFIKKFAFIVLFVYNILWEFICNENLIHHGWANWYGRTRSTLESPFDFERDKILSFIASDSATFLLQILTATFSGFPIWQYGTCIIWLTYTYTWNHTYSWKHTLWRL